MTTRRTESDKVDERLTVDEAMAAAVHEKLLDAMTAGFEAEFDPDEAELAGAFEEDALSEEEARESVGD